MLSPLQQQIRQVVASLPGGDEMALAGGAALILHGVVERTTRDLDFFATSAAQVDRLVPAVVQALESEGLAVERVTVESGFARLMVSGGDEQTLIDLAWDARQFPLIGTPGGPLLTQDELAADKTLALFGRAAARDFVDVAALTSRYGIDELCRRAAEKDPGFDRSVMADMLTHIERLPRTDFDLTDAEYRRLRGQVDEWRRHLTQPELGQQPERTQRGVDPPGLGL